jgi:hypothetical protein
MKSIEYRQLLALDMKKLEDNLSCTLSDSASFPPTRLPMTMLISRMLSLGSLLALAAAAQAPGPICGKYKGVPGQVDILKGIV